jgi:hypothetical protein
MLNIMHFGAPLFLHQTAATGYQLNRPQLIRPDRNPCLVVRKSFVLTRSGSEPIDGGLSEISAQASPSVDLLSCCRRRKPTTRSFQRITHFSRLRF